MLRCHGREHVSRDCRALHQVLTPLTPSTTTIHRGHRFGVAPNLMLVGYACRRARSPRRGGRSFRRCHHLVTPVLDRLRVCFHPVLPIPRHGDGGVQLSPFSALRAASAITPQKGPSAWYYVNLRDAPTSSISSPLQSGVRLPPRSQVCATFDGYEASLLFFPAVAVSGSIVYMTGYDFVGSSCDEVPVADPSHALGFFLICFLSVHVPILVCRLPPRCCVGRQFLSRRAVLQFPVLCAPGAYPSCCSSYSPCGPTCFWCVLLSLGASSFTGRDVCRVAESSIEATTANDREPTHIPFCCLGLLKS